MSQLIFSLKKGSNETLNLGARKPSEYADGCWVINMMKCKHPSRFAPVAADHRPRLRPRPVRPTGSTLISTLIAPQSFHKISHEKRLALTCLVNPSTKRLWETPTMVIDL